MKRDLVRIHTRVRIDETLELCLRPARQAARKARLAVLFSTELMTRAERTPCRAFGIRHAAQRRLELVCTVVTLEPELLTRMKRDLMYINSRIRVDETLELRGLIPARQAARKARLAVPFSTELVT